jgi:multidrug resistance efflux pump
MKLSNERAVKAGKMLLNIVQGRYRQALQRRITTESELAAHEAGSNAWAEQTVELCNYEGVNPFTQTQYNNLERASEAAAESLRTWEDAQLLLSEGFLNKINVEDGEAES